METRYNLDNIIGSTFKTSLGTYKVIKGGVIDLQYNRFINYDHTTIINYLNRGDWKIINSPKQIHEVW